MLFSTTAAPHRCRAPVAHSAAMVYIVPGAWRIDVATCSCFKTVKFFTTMVKCRTMCRAAKPASRALIINASEWGSVAASEQLPSSYFLPYRA